MVSDSHGDLVADFRLRDSHGHPAATIVLNLPAAVGARVHVEGHGQGTYVRFDFNMLPPVLHCIDFDEGGEKTFKGDSACRDRWCRRPQAPHQKIAGTIQCTCWPSERLGLNAAGRQRVAGRRRPRLGPGLHSHRAGGGADDRAEAGEHVDVRAAGRDRAAPRGPTRAPATCHPRPGRGRWRT